MVANSGANPTYCSMVSAMTGKRRFQQEMAYVGTRLLDVMFGLTAQPNPYPSGAISCWNLRLPVIAETMQQYVGLAPEFATIHEGIPAVLDDSISFYWLPSNLDRL